VAVLLAALLEVVLLLVALLGVAPLMAALLGVVLLVAVLLVVLQAVALAVPGVRLVVVTLLRAQGPDVGGLRSRCALSSTRRSLVEWGLVSLLSEHLQSKAKSIGK
jgi:hypothetical protein